MKHKNWMGRLCFAALLAVLAAGGCSRSSNGAGKVGRMETQSDSVAYVLGMNVARNLLKMDSTLNAGAVCAGIRDYFEGKEKLSPDEAQTFYLHYVNVARPENIRAYEDRYLEDIRRNNRSYARTESGLTYTVEEVGDEKLTPKYPKDTVSIRYAARTLDGRTFDSSFERGDTARVALNDLPEGMRESVKLIGRGGHIKAYVPAALGYGAEGCDSLGVKPNSTLYYEIDLLEVERPAVTAADRHGRRQVVEF